MSGVDSLNDWNSSFNSQVVPTTGDYVTPFQTWLASEANKLTLELLPAAVFVFNAPIFGAGISGLVPSMDKSIGLEIFATAWANAVSASTMIVPSGTAVVTNVAIAKSTVYDIMYDADISEQSAFPEAMRAGFLSLIYTVTIFGTPPVIFPSGTL